MAKSVESENVEYIFTPTGLDRVLDKTSNAGSKLLRSAGRANPRRPLFASPWHHLGYAAEVARRVRQLGCDVVHVTNYSQFVPVIRKLHPRCKIVLHMHCEWLNQLDASLVEKRLKQTDIVMGCSEYITRKAAEKFPQCAHSCVTVPAGGELSSNGASHPDGRAVLCVNRLSPEKGIHILIRAFHQVLKKFPDATLHLVGGAWAVPLELLVELSDEPQVKALRVFYQKRGNGAKDPYVEVLENEAGPELGRRIIFEGHVVHNQIGQYYQRAAVLVSSSIWNEPYGPCFSTRAVKCSLGSPEDLNVAQITQYERKENRRLAEVRRNGRNGLGGEIITTGVISAQPSQREGVSITTLRWSVIHG